MCGRHRWRTEPSSGPSFGGCHRRWRARRPALFAAVCVDFSLEPHCSEPQRWLTRNSSSNRAVRIALQCLRHSCRCCRCPTAVGRRPIRPTPCAAGAMARSAAGSLEPKKRRWPFVRSTMASSPHPWTWAMSTSAICKTGRLIVGQCSQTTSAAVLKTISIEPFYLSKRWSRTTGARHRMAALHCRLGQWARHRESVLIKTAALHKTVNAHH